MVKNLIFPELNAVPKVLEDQKPIQSAADVMNNGLGYGKPYSSGAWVHGGSSRGAWQCC